MELLQSYTKPSKYINVKWLQLYYIKNLQFHIQ